MDTITLEYSRVKATMVSVRLRIYLQSLKYPTIIQFEKWLPSLLTLREGYINIR